MQIFLLLLIFLVLSPTIAHYSSSESTSKEVLNTVTSDDSRQGQGEFYPRKDTSRWSKLAN